MQITLPATAHGGPEASSVLDLEPFLEFARQCRPDAVSLMPPPGADDQPNGAALLAMKDRLEAEGIGVVAGRWEVAEDAPVLAPAWQAQTTFELRALLAALGEAGVQPLTLSWRAPSSDPAYRQALAEVLGRLLDEAERAEVRVALQARLPIRDASGVLRALDSPWLGLSAHLAGFLTPTADLAHQLRAAGDSLFAIETAGPPCTVSGPPEARAAAREGWALLLASLSEGGFSGPFLVRDLATPIEYAHALGFFRGVTTR